MRLLLLIIINFLLLGCISAVVKQDGTTLILTVPYTFIYSNNIDWQEINYRITHTTAKNIIFKWTGRGGYTEIGFPFIEAVEKAKQEGKTIVFDVIGYSASMHALAACRGTTLILEPDSYLLFHLMEVAGSVPMDKDSLDLSRRLMAYCIPFGILTNDDINIVLTDKELWVYSDGHKVFKHDRRVPLKFIER